MTFRKGHRQDLNPCYHVMHLSPSATKAKLNPLWSPPPLWLTSPLKVTRRLMSWSLTEEMCLTLRPSRLPPPVMIIIFSYLHSRRLSHSRLFGISLEDIPAFHPPIFLSALLSLIPVVRWKAHYSKLENHGGFRGTAQSAASWGNVGPIVFMQG